MDILIRTEMKNKDKYKKGQKEISYLKKNLITSLNMQKQVAETTQVQL